MFSVGKVVQNEKEWQSGDDTVPFYFGLGEDISFRKGTVTLSLPSLPLFTFHVLFCFLLFLFLLLKKSGCGISLVFFEKFTCVSEIPQ